VIGALPPDAAGPVVAERQVRPGEVELFMFSAATWLTHRIHFDRHYARTEGHPDLVVHGPLQGAYLAGLLSDLAGRHGGELAWLTYRHHRPAYCAELLTMQAALVTLAERPGGPEAELALSIRNANGVVVTSGQGLIRLPGPDAAAGLLSAAGTAT
jgi:acyl dehydratase